MDLVKQWYPFKFASFIDPRSRSEILNSFQFLSKIDFLSGSGIQNPKSWTLVRIKAYADISVPDPERDPPGSKIIRPQGSGSEIINFGSESGSGSRSSPFSHQT